jgi:hypothetical protein
MEETQILEPIPIGNPLWRIPIKMKSTIMFFDELNKMDLQTIPTMPFLHS